MRKPYNKCTRAEHRATVPSEEYAECFFYMVCSFGSRLTKFSALHSTTIQVQCDHGTCVLLSFLHSRNTLVVYN